MTPAEWVAKWSRLARVEYDVGRLLRVLSEVRPRGLDRFRVRASSRRHAHALASLLSLMVEEAGGSGRFRTRGEVVEASRFRWPDADEGR